MSDAKNTVTGVLHSGITALSRTVIVAIAELGEVIAIELRSKLRRNDRGAFRVCCQRSASKIACSAYRA